MKIVITGGHHNSALVVAKELIKRGNDLYWFGHKYTMLGDKEVSAEYKEVKQANIRFYTITAGKLQIKQNCIVHLLRIPYGFLQNIFLLLTIRPNLIYSSGGYIALPTCIIGYLMGIPVFTHEQAVVTGLANRIIAMFAKRVYIAFPNNFPYSSNKTLYTGLPIPCELYTNLKRLFANNRRTIYFTGGKQGSHRVNEAVFEVLPELLKNYNIIHQCGSNTIYNDYQKALSYQKQLTGTKGHYIISDYYPIQEIGSVYYSSDLVVGRAGAHTAYELLYLNKPCLLIPIPWTHNNEQGKNAQLLVDCGIGKILPESQLSGDSVMKNIKEMISNLESLRLNDNFKPVNNTVDLIINDIYTTIANNSVKH